MNKTQAIKSMKEKGQITTGMLDALNISMDSWLTYCQKPKEERASLVNRLIIALENN